MTQRNDELVMIDCSGEVLRGAQNLHGGLQLDFIFILKKL